MLSGATMTITISIHALREEGDTTPTVSLSSGKRFLSTPSARRATKVPAIRQLRIAISIHALREEGDDPVRRMPWKNRSISIHALREEGDRVVHRRRYVTETFLSTPSARRATVLDDAQGLICNISIHALREEGDSVPSRQRSSRTLFLSTPSARRATP